MYKSNRNLKEIIGSNKILNNKVIQKRKKKRNSFSVTLVTQDKIIFAFNKKKKEASSKVIKQEKHIKYSTS